MAVDSASKVAGSPTPTLRLPTQRSALAAAAAPTVDEKGPVAAAKLGAEAIVPLIAAAGSGPGGPTIPEWVKDAVFYQIFPDRFANGDVGNDPNGTMPWGAAPTNDSISGGDVNGITQKLGYLTKLGVNALYMNPIFTSPSNHGYDITDYEHVNPRLGGNDAFKQLIDGAHKNGVKVMLDGVLNHTSHQHPWFTDVRQNGPKSQFFDRFTVNQWPIHYERDADGILRSPDYKSWWGYASLPVLTNDNPKVRDYFLTGKDAIVKKWITDYKIDGWRMDVADELPADYWKTARTAIKQADPNAYLVAENWHDASSMVQGDQFDGAMNYQYFQQPANEFFAKKTLSPDDFIKRLGNNYPGDAKFGMLNILDSHDTPRFIEEAGGDWYRLRAAAIFQMTYVGAPVVYYGDELGVAGGKDPDSRRTFPWQNVPGTNKHDAGDRTGLIGNATVPAAPATPPAAGAATGAAVAANNGLPPAATMAPIPDPKVSAQLFDLYSKLISTRKKEDVLRRGDFSVLMTHNDSKTLAYRRALPGNARDATDALNNDTVSHDVTVPVGSLAADGTAFLDALSGTRFLVKDGNLTVPGLNGNFGAVLMRESGNG
ncbi:MAG: glycoside hydrolase family 13 protein [Thermoleophilia bacterium]|nr:glycoside hydrolase family 13 protein [Thermoleophilia bacterium]